MTMYKTQVCHLMILAKSLNLFPQLSNGDKIYFLTFLGYSEMKPFVSAEWRLGAVLISMWVLAANKL